VVAIIPVREFEKTKLRMRDALNSSERAALTRSLLCHVLGQMQQSRVSSIIIVASEKGPVSRIARRFSKTIVIEESVYHGGVNRAMEDAMSYSMHHRSSSKFFMLVPSDLPLLSTEAINDAMSKLNDYDLIISPSMRCDGTSLLLLNFPKGKIPLHYDNDSYRQHLKEARRLKIRYSILRKKEFMFDVDSIGDLSRLMGDLKVKSLKQLFRKLAAQKRAK
jgi:2-phospho-L-lactate guanylyltransferase